MTDYLIIMADMGDLQQAAVLAAACAGAVAYRCACHACRSSKKARVRRTKAVQEEAPVPSAMEWPTPVQRRRTWQGGRGGCWNRQFRVVHQMKPDALPHHLRDEDELSVLIM